MQVLDEVHHTDKAHPYAMIMGAYQQLDAAKRPQVRAHCALDLRQVESARAALSRCAHGGGAAG